MQLMLKKMIFSICTVLPLFAFSYVSNEGDPYQTNLLKDRAVMTSESKKIYILDYGVAMTASKESKHQIVLLKNCRAQSNLLGKGKWYWANGGLFTEFESREIFFPKQETPFKSNICAG